MELTELLGLLEYRLALHENNLSCIQDRLQELCDRIKEEANKLEKRIRGEIDKAFSETEKRILEIAQQFNSRLENQEDGSNLFGLIKRAHDELSYKQEYEIISNEWAFSFPGAHDLYISQVRADKEFDLDVPTYEETIIEPILDKLEEFLEEDHDSMVAAQDETTRICDLRRKESEELEKRIKGKLEPLYYQEDARLHEITSLIREKIDTGSPEELRELKVRAIKTLVTPQKYELSNLSSWRKLDELDLIVKREVSLDFLDLYKRAPLNFTPVLTSPGEVTISFTFFSEDETEALKSFDLPLRVEVRMWKKGHSELYGSHVFEKEYTLINDGPVSFQYPFEPGVTYLFYMWVVCNGKFSQQTNKVELTVPKFSECVWGECPDGFDEKYSVKRKNPRIVTNIGKGENYCVIIGNAPLPLNQVTSWSIKILESKNNDGEYILTGVIPFDINKSIHEFSGRGWYFDCYDSTLFSGLPHNCRGKGYGPRKEEYVHTGDSVGVVMDTTKGDLSFVLNGVNLGVAYDGIPLDKPLLPCVLLGVKGDSVELVLSEVKENVNPSIFISNLTAKSTTWNTMTVTWDAVEGASFYQIEVDGSNSWKVSTRNTFTKQGFFSNTEHTFRVRAVKGNEVSEWSSVVKRRTQRAPNFSECVWKECPDYVSKNRRYSVDEKNPRIATNIGNGENYCIIIGNTPLPRNKMTPWNIIISNPETDGKGIYIGVAPFDINQDCGRHFKKFGWYLHCHNSSLWSGPPHFYNGNAYRLRGRNRRLASLGYRFGVLMNTSTGKLSFVIRDTNHGIAYDGIPLDKPLVPSVVLAYERDSVHIITS